MSKWKATPIEKMYEALGAVADDRLELIDDTKAKCYSSTGNKYYDIEYNKNEKAIMANDNASYWNGYLGYPAIAYLLKIGELEYRSELAGLLKGVAWKDINQKFKNDFGKAVEFIFKDLDNEKVVELRLYAKQLTEDLKALHLTKLGKRKLPPKGY